VSDLVIHNARVMTCDPARLGLGLIDHGAIALSGAAIRWVGPEAERPRGDREIDAGGRLISPGLIDCHTHAMFAGERANEFGMRPASRTSRSPRPAAGSPRRSGRPAPRVTPS
jgi:imidazolonepropionase